ncbi:MAG TPA: heme exporter protein CcmB [Telluria sp.]
MLSAFACLVRRDLMLAWRRRADVAGTLVFFLVVASLFPLAVGPEPALLRTMGAGVVWIAALLASMLALGRLFEPDHADGTLEQLLLSPVPLALLVLAKVAAHWLVSGLPLVLLAPVLALQYDLPSGSGPVLAASLLLGTPVLGFIGAMAAALTLGVRGGGVLIGLIVLPLYIPVLIFGTAAAGAVASGMDAGPYLMLLGAMLAAAVALAPWATAAGLRIAME